MKRNIALMGHIGAGLLATHSDILEQGQEVTPAASDPFERDTYLRYEISPRMFELNENVLVYSDSRASKYIPERGAGIPFKRKSRKKRIKNKRLR